MVYPKVYPNVFTRPSLGTPPIQQTDDTMAKLTDIQIRAWIKAGERFEGRSDGKGLYLRYRAGAVQRLHFNPPARIIPCEDLHGR